MTALLQDLRHSFRLLAKTPGFTAAAIAVLALGIGLNTAMFSFVHALIFQARPFAEPERIVQLYTHDQQQPDSYRAFDYASYRALRDQPEVFTGVLAHHLSLVGVGEAAGVRRAFADLVSANFFAVLGVQPTRGRFFTLEEEKPGAALPVVVVSHLYWRTHGARDDLLGSTLRVNGRPYTIVGVAPENFSGTMMLVGPEFYFPLGVFDQLINDFEKSPATRALEQPGAFHLYLLARLQRGVTIEAARSALAGVSASLQALYPVTNRDQVLDLGPLPRFNTSRSPSGGTAGLGLFGLVLIGLTAAVLLIICLNLAGLLLARGHARRREIAIRLALGGGRLRIIRQLLVEGFVLALAGGAAGLFLAYHLMDLLLAALADRVPVALFFPGVGSGPALVATVFFCGLATLFSTLGPAVKLSRTDVLADLKLAAGDDTSTRRHAWLPRHPLVVAQIALSLALLIAAGLFVRMAHGAASVDNGYRADQTIIAEVDASLGGYDETRTRVLYRDLGDRLAALPGVEAASIGALIPHGMVGRNQPVQRAGFKLDPSATPATAAEGRAFWVPWNAVGTDYFAAMGVALQRGRRFTRTEVADRDAPAVAIIDDTLARKLWPEGDALGRQIQLAPRDDVPAAQRPEPKAMEVVGIVSSVHNDFFEDDFRGAIYVPFAAGFMSNVHFHVRPAAGIAPSALAASVRQTIQAAAPGLPVFKVHTFRQHIENSLEFWALTLCSLLFLIFGGLAMAIAVVGIYGTQAYAVSRRTREIGIRLALGAEPTRVRNLILREGLALTLTGTILGLLLGLGTGQLLSAIMADLDGFDPLAYALAATALFAAALLACWLPARRATKVDPLVALRTE